MKIGVIGTGYVGLVSGTCFAQLGNVVQCVDNNQEKIESLKQGKVPIYEPGLNELIKENVDEKRLFFTTDIKSVSEWADAIFIAVGTPTSRRGDGYADLSYVYGVAKEIAPYLKGYTVIVDKSTVPVGTARQVKRIIKEVNPEADFDVASNPEFLREGDAIKDFMHPDRVVLGVETEKAGNFLKNIYRLLELFETPIVITSLETAELTKYASNAFLATKISFINEMASLCEVSNANVIDLARGMGLDKRIGDKFLKPGPGFGGSCFPKDVSALMRIGQEQGVPIRIVETVNELNAAQKAKMVKKIREAIGGNESGKTIAVLGLTFKADTDDMREAQSITILTSLLEKGAKVNAYDPQGMPMAKKIMPDIQYFDDQYEACKGADCVVLMTEWKQFKNIDFDRLRKVVKEPIFVDLRNHIDSNVAKKHGFNYRGLGVL